MYSLSPPAPHSFNRLSVGDITLMAMGKYDQSLNKTHQGRNNSHNHSNALYANIGWTYVYE